MLGHDSSGHICLLYDLHEASSNIFLPGMILADDQGNHFMIVKKYLDLPLSVGNLEQFAVRYLYP